MSESENRINNEQAEGDGELSTQQHEQGVKMSEGDSSVASATQSEQPTGDLISKPGVIYEDKNETGFCSDASDSEWDTDLETEEHIEAFDATGRKVYIAACKSLEITPVSFFLRHIQDPRVDLKHRGLGPKGAKAMAIALVLNTSVISLNLQDNSLESEGGVYIADMLKENCYLTELDISSNKLGSRGCQSMCDMLQNNTNLLKINMADNNFSDKDTNYLVDTFRGNEKLTWLDLSHNRFSEDAGVNLGLGITSNDSLEYLNLSWNHLRRKGALEIAHGLRSNCTLKTFDISYNGFADDGAAALGEALRANNTLVELDVSNNRITTQGALCIAKGLEGNNTLEILKIGSNPINSEGVFAILKAAMCYCDSALMDIHCQDVYLDQEFDSLLHDMHQLKADFKVIPKPRARAKDPLKALRRHVEGNQDKWLESLEEFDSDRTNQVSRGDFLKGLKGTGFQLDFEDSARLLSQLDPHKEGLISYIDKRLGVELPEQVAE